MVGPPTITKATPLAQTGTIAPLSVTSHPKMKRSNCSACVLVAANIRELERKISEAGRYGGRAGADGLASIR